MKKKSARVQQPEVEAVRLKPILGMEPGKYLTILYATALLVILFFLLLYPGLRTYGSQVMVSSTPQDAALYVDGTYRGSTPLTLFLGAGRHELRFEHPHFADHTLNPDIGGRRFASLMFPRRESIEAELRLQDRAGLLAERFRQISDWAMVGTFFDRYRYPGRAADTVAAVLSAEEASGQSGESQRQVLSSFLHNLTNNMSTPELTADLISAAGLLYDEPTLAELRADSYSSTGSGYSPSLFNRAMEVFRQFRIDSPLLPLYGYLAAEEAVREDFAAGLSIDQTLRQLKEEVRDLPFAATYSDFPGGSQAAAVRVAGHGFVFFDPPPEIPVGNDAFSFDIEDLNYQELASYPHSEETSSFYLASELTSQDQYARFLEENPRWREDNREALISEGLVQEDYLRYPQRSGDIPVSNISWHAAKAYCQWLNSKLPEKLRDSYRAALPTEVQWEYAARLNGMPRSIGKDDRVRAPRAPAFSRAGSAGMIDMLGNVWEWNRNWYFPADLLDGTYGLEASRRYSGVERAVRGGSWANEVDERFLWTRGSQPPSWCSPFTGFRVALVPAESDQ
jgi:formylglycine-generating enzyme required for sulfatase activity